MRLTQRNGIWMLDYRDPTGKRRRLSTGTRDKAEAERSAHDLLTGRDRRSAMWTLSRALDHTLRTVWDHQKDARGAHLMVTRISADVGHLILREITYGVLEDYVAVLRGRDLAPATINRRLARIAKAMKEAAKRDVIAAVPPMPKMPEKNGRTRWLDEAEEISLISAVDRLPGLSVRERDTLEAIIVFLIETGARQGELRKLTRRDLINRRAVFADTKNGKSRSVPLTPTAESAAYHIVRISEAGEMWAPTRLSKLIKKAAVLAGFDDVTGHTLRHTCASRLVQAGYPMEKVRDWLGHSSVVVTERYAHLKPDALDDGAELLANRRRT